MIPIPTWESVFLRMTKFDKDFLSTGDAFDFQRKLMSRLM